jgi:hypothetical protein
MNKLTLTILTLLATFSPLLAAPVNAQTQDPEGVSAGWAFSLGAFDFIDSDKAAEAGIEYRWRPFRLWKLDLKPVVGIAGTDEESFWGYGGFRWDVPIGSDRWIPTIGFAVSLYDQGDGKNLGGTVEFRSSFEIAYRFDGGSRLGLSIYHLSNARVYDLNPGSESLVLTWSTGR